MLRRRHGPLLAQHGHARTRGVAFVASRHAERPRRKISECACYDRCDTVSSGCKHTCDVLVNQMGYNCSELYAPGMKYEGWCDKTCGYGKCDK